MERAEITIRLAGAVKRASDTIERIFGRASHAKNAPPQLAAIAAAPRGEDVKAAMDLLVVEYGSLRSESLQAMGSQQAILTWSLAAFGGALAAGLILATSVGKFRSHQSEDVTFLLIFSCGLPGLSFAACLAWFGELIRMERVGHYIRGIEAIVGEFYQSTGVGQVLPYLAAPLRWETYIAFGAKNNPIATKRQMGYFGHLTLYTGSITLSLAIGCTESWVFGFKALAVALTAYSAVTLMTFVAIVLRVRSALLWGARQVADINAVIPSVNRNQA